MRPEYRSTATYSISRRAPDDVCRKAAVLFGPLHEPDVVAGEFFDALGRGDCGDGLAGVDLAGGSFRLWPRGAVDVGAEIVFALGDGVVEPLDGADVERDSQVQRARQTMRRPVCCGDQLGHVEREHARVA